MAQTPSADRDGAVTPTTTRPGETTFMSAALQRAGFSGGIMSTKR
jgi:hypothetical protein